MEGFDYIQAIGAELQKADQAAAEMSERIGIFTVKTANRTIREAALRPNPDALWLTLWYEGEVCCLFSDSNLGKSIYAIQIATSIAKKQKVLYFDFELSDKQFQLRYGDEANNLNQFPDNLYRVEINRDSLDAVNFEEAVIGNIEQTAIKLGAKVLIIDNLLPICVLLRRKEMQQVRLCSVDGSKKEIRICQSPILAHTLNGVYLIQLHKMTLPEARKIYNFFDSVFAIGKSAKNSKCKVYQAVKR